MALVGALVVELDQVRHGFGEHGSSFVGEAVMGRSSHQPAVALQRTCCRSKGLDEDEFEGARLGRQDGRIFEAQART